MEATGDLPLAPGYAFRRPAGDWASKEMMNPLLQGHLQMDDLLTPSRLEGGAAAVEGDATVKTRGPQMGCR